MDIPQKGGNEAKEGSLLFGVGGPVSPEVPDLPVGQSLNTQLASTLDRSGPQSGNAQNPAVFFLSDEDIELDTLRQLQPPGNHVQQSLPRLRIHNATLDDLLAEPVQSPLAFANATPPRRRGTQSIPDFIAQTLMDSVGPSASAIGIPIDGPSVPTSRRNSIFKLRAGSVNRFHADGNTDLPSEANSTTESLHPRKPVFLSSSPHDPRTCAEVSCPICNGSGPRLRTNSVFPTLERDQRSNNTIVSGFDSKNMALKQGFLIKLCKALSLYGSPTHRLEFLLESVANALEVDSTWVVFPGMVFLSFGMSSEKDDVHTETHLVKISQNYNMGKLVRINQLCLSISNQELTIEAASSTLTDIIRAPDFPKWMMFLCVPISAFTLAVLGFNGAFLEAGISAALGCVVGAIGIAGDKFPHYNFLFDFWSALVTSFCAKTIQWLYMTKINPQGCINTICITLSSLVMLLPGLSLTTALIEISTRNLVSGTVRLVESLFKIVILGFGLAVGSTLVQWYKEPLKDKCEGESIYWNILMFPLLSIGNSVYFKSDVRLQFPINFLVAGLGYVTFTVLSRLVFTDASQGVEVVTTITAFVIGLTSNFYAWWTLQPAISPILSGMLLLVPGSLGVRGFLGLLGETSFDGSSFALQIILTGLSIVVGLFVGNFFFDLPLKNKNKGVHMTV
ncbi:hypothetical protein BJ742DRAFT_821919 [Cladochytrium replicatum]|nr:hypothetical protein BJ742DRAFT_821919 [Cladochytrium replicatum]